MSLQRSHTAPQPLPLLAIGQNTIAKPARSVSQVHLNNSTPERLPLYLQQIGHKRRAVTPRLEREDPFSLQGFFPNTNEEWNWLREEGSVISEDSDEEREELKGDMEAGKLIKEEDKMGILNADPVIGSDEDAYGRLLSPYTDDEAIDHDSLYRSLCARRLQNGLSVEGKIEERFPNGGLFFAKEPEQHGTSNAVLSRLGKIFWP